MNTKGNFPGIILQYVLIFPLIIFPGLLHRGRACSSGFRPHRS